MLDHKKLLAGDPTATTLFLVVARQWARKFFRKRSQLDEVTQSAIAEMLDKLGAGNIPERERTVCWVLTCANNAVRRELTRVRNNKAVSYQSALHCPDTAGPNGRVRARDELQRVNALLEECDAGARRILEARGCGYTYQEIADEFGIGEAAARASVSRLRKKLTAKLVAQHKRETLFQQVLRTTIARHQLAPRVAPRSESSSSSSSPAARR